jgi:hypothetical protein
MDFADHGPVLYLEHRFGGLLIERPEAIAQCRLSLLELGEVALNEGHSREFLAQLASGYDQPGEGAS